MCLCVKECACLNSTYVFICKSVHIGLNCTLCPFYPIQYNMMCLGKHVPKNVILERMTHGAED